MVLDGFGRFQMVSGGFGWFQVVCCFSCYRSTAALVVAEGKLFRKLWKNEDLFSKSFIFIPFNLNNCHWILVVVNISERTIGVLATDTHWTDTSIQRGYQIGKSDANENWFNRCKTSKHQT